MELIYNMIYRFIFTIKYEGRIGDYMEQWNIFNDEEFSLNELLEQRYLKMLITTKGLDEKSLKGDTISQKIINATLSECKTENEIKCTDQDNFIDYQKKLIFKILDSVLKNCRKAMRNTNGEYILTSSNYYFLNTLLDLYVDNDENCKALVKKEYSKLDENFLEMLYHGLCDFAENKNFLINIDYVRRQWNMIFSVDYTELCDTMEILRMDIQYYGSGLTGKEENSKTLQEMKQKILECNEEILKIVKDKIEFPDIDINELEKDAKIRLKKKKLRTEKYKNAWKKRKGNK